MAEQYIANADDLIAVADAIRTKSGATGRLNFPDGFVSAIEEITGGGDKGLKATAGAFTLSGDINDYVLTHGLGEVPEFFMFGMANHHTSFYGHKYFIVCGYGFNSKNMQYRMAVSTTALSPGGIYHASSITDSAGNEQSITEANAETIKLADSGGTSKLVSGARYYWVAIGKEAFFE